ncbi:MAG TPA: ABC transporter ATP-binding protein [Dehalococcoidia bacterium]|jgi:iron complex transport system ATP-binding protein|nr:ABC transporter ATP-binding protein [Dehalococcoidia bacterium]
MRTAETEKRENEMPARTAAVSVVALTVAYTKGKQALVALRDVCFTLATGELLGLVGPNGSGKTTLIRAVTKVVRPVSGEIRIRRDDVASLSQAEVARRVAVVPQEPQLPESFTTLDCVLMGRSPHLRLLENEGARDFEAARGAMERTETWELAERPVGELSGGERQRVVVARALAQETPIMLLDEPTAHLDIGHQASVLGLMRALCREESKAVLAVVHDLTLAAAYCDRLVMLGPGGTVAAEGAPADILRADVLSEVYGAEVEVFAHPRTGRPVVAPRVEGG